MAKRILHIFLLALFFFSANAQQPPKKEKDFKGKSVFDLKNYKGDPRDRLIFELNHTGWINAPAGINMDWKCISFNFACMFDKPIGASNFSFGFGMGIYCHNFSSNADWISKLDASGSNVTTVIQPKTIPYAANRYNEKSVEIPLELRIRTKSATMFKVMFGVKIGYVFADYNKTDDKDGILRRYDMKNINHLRYGVNFRIGLESICLTGCYYFSEIFTSNGPKGITPYSIGIAIIPY